MIFSDRLARAVQRLNGALDKLEAVAARRAEADAARADVDLELTLLQDDRSRLGLELDAARVRALTLDRANDDVSERLERASATVRAILIEMSGGEMAAAEPPAPAEPDGRAEAGHSGFLSE